MILFSTIGNRPFLDYIYTIQDDGSKPKPFLIPTPNRSYMHASGNSLRDALAVTVHETDSTGKINNHLYTYDPVNQKWKALVTEGSVGEALMSPDGTRIVFEYAPPPRELSQFRLWIVDLKSGEKRKLTDQIAGDQSWDSYASWRPDSQEITFIRTRPSPRGIETTLMGIPSSGGEPRIMLEGVGVLGAHYSPDGTRLAVKTKNGLEIVKLSTIERTVVVPKDSIADRVFSPGGLLWSKTHDRLAFSCSNRRTALDELWTVSSNGSNLRQIYSQKDARMTPTSFIEK